MPQFDISTIDEPDIDGAEVEDGILLAYRVYDCSENRKTCPNLVGLTFLHWPPEALTVEVLRIHLI